MTTRRYHRADTVGVYPVCKGCPALKDYRQHNAHTKKYREAHPDKMKEYDAEYKKSHVAELKKYRADRWQRNKNKLCSDCKVLNNIKVTNSEIS